MDVSIGVLLFAGVMLLALTAAVIVGIVVILRRSHRSPQASPAESSPADSTRATEPTARRAADRADAEAAASEEDLRAAAVREAQTAVAGIRATAEEAALGIRADADAYHRDTRGHADALLREAQQSRHDADDETRTQRGELRDQRVELERREQRLAEREARLDEEARLVTEKAHAQDETAAALTDRAGALDLAEEHQRLELERVAGLTAEQAKTELVGQVEHEAKRQATIISRDIESAAARDGEAKAQRIIVGAIQRMASEQTAESVVTAVHLPGDDMKGRIIGREGRNIRCFEQVTGVNVMIDDTPESVLLSCFDPVRRETARITLTELVEDGRIHPARIEEVHERSKTKIEERCLRAAEDALSEVGISDLHADLVPVLGSLKYRTSYGQNVLKHLVECAHIAGVMAAELGLDVAQCKRSAFLHDIGKALTHEVEGSHALIGADLARKFGEHPDIVHAIEAHHNEVAPRTVEAILTQAADAISGGRPGARRESLESYVQRLERLEEIAGSREGVEKVYAMQAGREVRVMVTPDVVDDIEAQVLARDIVKQIEEELTYPGQIRVIVVRESRATETAR
ncbi:MAG: ribonuclease Y [Propionibacteriaceae bacterium]